MIIVKIFEIEFHRNDRCLFPSMVFVELMIHPKEMMTILRAPLELDFG